MTQQDAINTIEQALNIAVQKGCFTMQDVQAILIAVGVVKESNKAPEPPIKPAK